MPPLSGVSPYAGSLTLRMAHSVHSLSASPLLFLVSYTPSTWSCLSCTPSIEIKWKQEVRKATLARRRQVHAFRYTEPRDWNDFFNDLVKLDDKPILGDGPAGTWTAEKLWITSRFWTFPVLTFIVVRSLVMSGCTDIDVILHVLVHSEGLVQLPTDILKTF